MTWGFHIYDFMIEGLGLRGNELLAYALIFSCTKNGNGSWHGGYENLAEMIGTTRLTAIKVMQRLVEDGLIDKKVVYLKDRQVNVFKADLKQIKELLEFAKQNGGKENIPEGVKKTYPPSIENIPNILDNTLNDNESINIYKGVKKFTKPSIEEIASYCLERKNGIDANYFFDYYESNGWKVGKAPMKDWKATIRNWERNQKPLPQTGSKMDAYNATLKDILTGKV